MSRPLIEICIEGVDDAVAAERGGGDRVELCASLLEGGITPSPGMVRATLAAVRIPIMAMVRPRGGDFLYSEGEFAAMLDDTATMRGAGVHGVVFGCLTPDGDIDEARMRALVDAAGPLSTTCHRAFDMTRDPHAALEALIRCGVDRVLTSGQRNDTLLGLPLLRDLVRQAAGRIKIMGCVLTTAHIAAVRDCGAPELHFAAPKVQPGGMRWRNPDVGMGGTELDREYNLTVTDAEQVRAAIAALEVGGARAN